MNYPSYSSSRPALSVLSLFGWVALLLFFHLPLSRVGLAASKRKKQVRANIQRDQRRGDISFRFSVGPQIYQMTTASGELLSTTIGERAFSLNLIPEYTYHFLDRTSFFVSLPLEIDVDIVVGATVGLGLGVGLRQHLTSFFFLDAQILLSFIRRSLFRLEFGGFAIGLGLSIPMGERFRLLVTAQTPFNFVDGFFLSIQGYLGFETFF